jgi:pimeloyl-ACP methyl ester carboxylesterase
VRDGALSLIEQLHSSDGTAIAVERSGEGVPVVLVDGALGSRRFGPNVLIAPLLAKRFTVFHYDRRGRGASGDTLPYHVVFEIDDLATVVDSIDGSPRVFGATSGGNLALRAAASGVPMAKLALWEPKLVNDGRPRLPREYSVHLDELIGGGHRGDAVEYFMTIVAGMPAESVAPMRSMPTWTALEAAAHTLAYDRAVVAESTAADGPWAERLSWVTTPTLVLDGGTTPLLTDAADALAATLPNARRQTITGQGPDIDTEALAAVLLDFFGTD